jgi:hypothetical protein
MATFCLSEVWFWVEYDNVVLYRLPILRLSFTYRLTLKGTLKLVDTKPCCCWYDSLCDISCTYIGLIPNPYPLVETMCFSSPGRWRLLDALTGHALVLHSWALNSQCTFNSTKSSGESSPRIDMSPHSDILSWFWANQYLFFLFNAACLAEEQQIPNLIVIGLTRSGLESTIYRTGDEHANHMHYTTDVVNILWITCICTWVLSLFIIYLVLNKGNLHI